jgi:hypothetical protein
MAIPDSPEFRGGPDAVLTVEALFRPNLDTVQARHTSFSALPIIGKAQDSIVKDWVIQMRNGRVEFYAEGHGEDYVLPGPSIGADTWHHVAVVIDGPASQIFLYVDGGLAAQDLGFRYHSAGTTAPVEVGHMSYVDPSINYFGGQVDEIRIWNHARTETELRSSRHSRLSGSESGLVGYWHFDDQSTDDATGNGHMGSLVDGTFVNATTTLIASPGHGQIFPRGTDSIGVVVNLLGQAPADHWHWSLDIPLAPVGVAGGHAVFGGDRTILTGLEAGRTYTLYAALADIDYQVIGLQESTTFTISDEVINLLSNADFEDGSVSPWIPYGDSTVEIDTNTAYTGNASLWIQPDQVGDVIWASGIWHPGIELRPGVTYTWSAFMKAVAPRRVNMKVELNHEQWQSAAERQQYLDTEWREYYLQFTPSERMRAASLVWHAAGSVTGFWLDNIRFHEGVFQPTAAAPVLAIVEPANDGGAIYPQGPISMEVGIFNHVGYWAWQLDAPFPGSGPPGGNLLPTDTPTALASAPVGAHTLYATLVDMDGNVLQPSVMASADFSVHGASPYVLDDEPKVTNDGFIASWLMLDPPIETGLSADSAVQGDFVDGERRLLPSPGDLATVTEDDQTHVWTRVNFEDLVDMRRAERPGNNLSLDGWPDWDLSSQYLAVYLKWEVSQSVSFRFGSDDSSESYFNGHPLHSSAEINAWWDGNAGSAVVPVVGGKWNVLIMATHDHTLRWAFSVNVDPAPEEVDTTGQFSSLVAFIDGPAGDSNGDGTVNVLDVTKIERIVAGIDSTPTGAVPDASGDGVVNVLDVTATERIVVGLPPVAAAPQAAQTPAVHVLHDPEYDDIVTLKLHLGHAVEAVDTASFVLGYQPEDYELLALDVIGLPHDATHLQHETRGQFRYIVNMPGVDGTRVGKSLAAVELRRLHPDARSPVTLDLLLGDTRARAILDQRLTIPMLRTPERSTLLPNYPNPFNPETWIPSELSEDAEVIVTVYDALGQVVRRLELGQQPAGVYRTTSRAAYWDGRNNRGEDVASGAYFVELRADEFREMRRLVLMK